MPAAHEYYSKHSRKLSGSQMSLPEQLKNASNDTPTGSMTYLPATKFSGSQVDLPEHNDPTTLPDAFYQQYHNEFAQSAGGPLRQGAIRTIDVDAKGVSDSGQSTASFDDRHAVRKNGLSTGDYESRPHMNSPGLRGRKSSVKNLVDQINATSVEEPPPMPAKSMSRNSSRNVSPVITQSRLQQGDTSQSSFNSAMPNTLSRYESAITSDDAATGPSRFAMGSGYGSPEMVAQNRRPLFGEVVAGKSATPIPGYGIQTFRRRSGSVGSPLQSPSVKISHDPKTASRSNYNAVTATENDFTLSSAVYVPPTQQSHHRRANSESPMTPTRPFAVSTPPTSVFAASQHRYHNSQSRIPVSIRRGSTSSDLEGRSSFTISTSQDPSDQSYDKPTQRSPRRRQRSPPAIQSPGQRGKGMSIPQGPKSPSLRANIIVPPPKISPPLRSSRPRLPVSSASTAASRAKMAEKFSALQKLNDEKRQAARRVARTPELLDIDLKARRLRITQALSRSLEGQDLKGTKVHSNRRDFSTSRTASPTLSAKSDFSENRNGIPAVVVDGAKAIESLSEDHTPVDGTKRQERAFSHNALDAMQGRVISLALEEDSPTLGSVGQYHVGRPTPLQTNLQRTDRSNEPFSAMTEGTMIDPEPQDDPVESSVSQNSIVDQIHSIRHQDSVHDSEFDTFSDRGDKESVQLILRDTLYLDDEEAIRKGYRTAPPIPGLTIGDQVSGHNQRDSWMSGSIEVSDEENETGFARLSNDVAQDPPEERSYPYSKYARKVPAKVDENVRSTIASDAYTIVNIVLQQHSTSGIVDQQFVDDVYHRILEDSPFTDENSLSADRIEQICLREIQDREQIWYKPTSENDSILKPQRDHEDNGQTPTKPFKSGVNETRDVNNWLSPSLENLGLEPPPLLKGHRYKSSLDSVEDWADTSPSVSDWALYAVKHDVQEPSRLDSKTLQVSLEDQSSDKQENQIKTDKHQSEIFVDVQEDSEMYSAPMPRPLSQAPPSLPSGVNTPTSESNTFGSAIIQRPQIPRRVTSVSQISRHSSRGSRGRQSPSMSAPVLAKVSGEEPVTSEQRRLKQRKNVIKELVDTEFTYEKDLRVLCDIYKQTASAALGEEDIKVLFGNVEQVQVFSKDFLTLLKSLAKPTYAMERPDRKKDRNSMRGDSSSRPKSTASTTSSNKANEPDLPTVEKDRETRIGHAFEASLADMERVYTDYIKNRHAANLRLEALQKSQSAREWLKECKENSSDITNAWNLDALLVKPVQRITKYPLLLKELVDSTPEDHPDTIFLRRALHEVTEVNIRINDVKKHAELVDQVLNRKRKDSDVRAGFSKAFGRRAEKLRQHVGMTELYEDSKYNEIKIHYDNNIVQLMVVGNDCSSYGRAITKWVNKMVEIASAAEAWVDVGHSNHQEAESRLRQFAMVIRGISTIALPDHLEQLTLKVLNPMQNAVDAMTKFKTDPKGLLQKREKRMIDYAQIKSKKDRGEKIDRKMTERMEQSEALNLEAKNRMRKLVTATAKLVQACQASLVQMQISWQHMVRQKLSAAMGISLEHLEIEDIEKDWQLDFDFQEASALSLGVCNGSLLAEAVNMVTLPPSSTTLNDEDSPRPSFTSQSKRSISFQNESPYPPIPDYDPRTSGTFVHQFHDHQIPFANPRARAQSAASARYARTPDLSQHGSANEGFSNFARYEPGQVPRLSFDTPSPSLGMLQADPPPRPGSSSTFFSASGTPPPQSQPSQPSHHQSTGSSIFSSAMPMSDSPVIERFSESTTALDPEVLFTAASVYEFNIDRSRREAGFPYLTYVTGEIFDIIGERGELWLAKNQDDPQRQIGWIWNKHFAKLAE